MRNLPDYWVTANLLEISEPISISINPKDFRHERFTLHSVPSFELRSPEELQGREIGSNKQIVSAGTLLVCKINPRINRIWIVGHHTNRVLPSTEWIAIKASPEINTKYLSFYLQNEHVRQHLAENASGVGGSLMRIRPWVLSALSLPLPSVAEQRRIVDEIEKQFTRLDSAVRSLDAIKRHLERYRAAILKAAFEGNLVPRGNDSGFKEPTQCRSNGKSDLGGRTARTISTPIGRRSRNALYAKRDFTPSLPKPTGLMLIA